MHALHVRVEGRVQGVGFRYFAQARAQALGLAGWVRNIQDGSVEAEAQGARATLEQWLEALRQGPPLSDVKSIAVDWQTIVEPFEDFQIR